MPEATILIVDDEPSIRTTMAAVLGREGYSVFTAANVGSALREIGQRKFDVLISDLNVGEPGDGFTVVSAMRRTQPQCVNYILTGYPAFESALEAIRSQVDGYLMKPTDVKQLIAVIAEGLKQPNARQHRHALKPVATVLRENADEIVRRTVVLMCESPLLRQLPLTDDERTGHVHDVVVELITQLESTTPDRSTDEAMTAAAVHGRVRRQHGYTLEMLVEDSRLVDHAIHDVVEANLLVVELSNLVGDLKRVNDTLARELEASVRAYVAADAAVGKPPGRADVA